VIRHQYPRGEAPSETLHGLAKEGEEHRVIDVVAEDGPLFIAARSDVIESARKLDAKRSCHSRPRFPRLKRIAEESPSGRRTWREIASEWKIWSSNVHEQWVSWRRRKERRCDPTDQLGSN
jgi:hypothetical protein